MLLNLRPTTIEDLNATVQRPKEGLADYVKRFWHLALDCYEFKSKEELVRICICNMVNSQRVFLENHDIPTFSLLLEKASKIALSMRITLAFIKRWEASQVVIAEIRFIYIREKIPRKDTLTSSKLPCKEEGFEAIVDSWIMDGLL